MGGKAWVEKVEFSLSVILLWLGSLEEGPGLRASFESKARKGDFSLSNNLPPDDRVAPPTSFRNEERILIFLKSLFPADCGRSPEAHGQTESRKGEIFLSPHI